MQFTFWYLAVGAVLVLMALAGSVLKRLPLSSAMFYMAVGLALGPGGLALLRVDVIDNAALLERITEVAVIISLFSAGLKLRLPLRDRAWRPTIRLASIGMVATVACLALAGMFILGLSPGAAVLLGAVLAPTDPVLASDVQVEHAHDREQVRFSLTGEAGLNDGTAFPFVMLGLGMLGLHELGMSWWRWFAIDMVWAVGAGLAIGTACGTLIGRLVIYLRREHREAVGLDDFLALGLIALSYGGALLIHSYGFLAVFAAGLALRRIERHHSGDAAPPDVQAAAHATEDDATHPEKAPAVMAEAVLGFNEQLERLGEVAIVLVIGAALALVEWTAASALFAAALFLLVRPLATFVSLAGTHTSLGQRTVIAWFGVRGVGSIYYLTYAIAHGVPDGEAQALANTTLLVIAASVVIHGISVTPLMRRYTQT